MENQTLRETLNPIVDKAKARLQALLASSVDGPERLVAEAILRGTENVRTLALDGGLATNQLRQIAWPYLLSERLFAEDDRSKVRDEKAESETFRQIELDVPRSVKPKDRERAERFMKEFFRKHRDLCFYQGFADVAYAVLRVMSEGVDEDEGEVGAHFVLSRLSRHLFIRDAHRLNFEAIYAYLPAIKAIVTRYDRDLGKLWEETAADNYWAISPLVCLFCHDLDLSVSAKILDAVIASERTFEFPVYLVSALVMLPDVKAKLLAKDHEPCIIHETLLDACRNKDNVDALISAAVSLQDRVPPKFVFKVVIEAGLPGDSQFVTASNTLTISSSTTKKRSWRTLTFFSSALEEIGNFGAQIVG